MLSFPSLPSLSEVVVLAREASDPREWEPYAAWAFRPCQPLVFFGRSAADDPACPREEAVFHFWRDRSSGSSTPC